MAKFNWAIAAGSLLNGVVTASVAASQATANVPWQGWLGIFAASIATAAAAGLAPEKAADAASHPPVPAGS